MASMRFFVMLLLLLTASLSTVNLAEEEDESCDSDSMECGGEKKTKIVDPRYVYHRYSTVKTYWYS